MEKTLRDTYFRTEHARLAAEDPAKANAYLLKLKYMYGYDPFDISEERPLTKKERKLMKEHMKKPHVKAYAFLWKGILWSLILLAIVYLPIIPTEGVGAYIDSYLSTVGGVATSIIMGIAHLLDIIL